jgi:ABC-type sulfate/molybdate transport systems ATPase subunit
MQEKKMLLGYHYALRQQIKETSKREKRNRKKEKIQPLQQAQLFIKHAATHRTQIAEDIVDMDQGLKTSSTRKGKASPKTSTHLSYRSTSKATSYQRRQKQCLWQHKHICTQHGQVQETQGNTCTGQHCKV